MTNTCSCKWLMSFSNCPASVTVDKHPIFPLYFLVIMYADVTNVCRLLVLSSASIAHYVVACLRFRTEHGKLNLV